MSAQEGLTRLERERYQLEANLNNAFMDLQRFKAEYPELKNGFYLNSPGSWLNAYREGDLSFQEAIELIEEYHSERPPTESK